MSGLSNIVFWTSLTGLCALSFFEYQKLKKTGRLFLWLALLAACGVGYFYIFQNRVAIASKGEQPNQSIFVIILYICMFMGMSCHYFYSWFLKSTREREPFDWRNFLAPVFASPIVFVPLLGAFQNADVDLTKLTIPKFMVFFVAFQNGFFWKEVVDNRGKEQK
jgi:hypothetical protein